MHSLDRYSMPPRYFNSGVMTPEQQYDWLRENEMADQRWAQTESEIRRAAVEIQNRLAEKGQTEIVTYYMLRPSESGPLGTESVRIAFMLTRLGAMEELLLIEEQLRRAMRVR